MRPMKGALFDLDGVLLDSEGTYSEFWATVDRRFPTGVPDFTNVIKGSNLQEILEGYFAAEVRQQVTDILMGFQREMRYEFFAGALDYVRHLNAAGGPCCVVTSSDNDKMASLYVQHPHFKSLFKSVVTGDMVTRAKPDPECFVLGAKLIGVDPSDCWVFEDSLKGLQAGRAAGACVVGLATTLSRAVIAPWCDRVVDSLAMLL